MYKYVQILIAGFVFSISTAFADVNLVSKTSTGEQGNGSSFSPVVSADGRVVAFESTAFNLVGNVRYESGIVVHNRDTGISKRIDPDTEIPRGYRTALAISADGRFVVFAVDLVYIYFTQYVYIHDLETGSTERVDLALTGEPVIGWSFRPTISADGRFIAYASTAPNIVEGDTNGTNNVDYDIGHDIFVLDRNTGITERVSVSSSGMQSDNMSTSTSISADGRIVAFQSRATNLVADDTNGYRDVFIHDRDSGVTERVSVSSSGEQGNSISFDPSVSADGRYVAFVSGANNLVADDTNGINDAFVHDRVTGITERVSISSAGEQADYDLEYSTYYSLSPSLSADGRYVAFESPATNLVAGDTNRSYDVFIRDRQLGETRRVSISKNGVQGILSSREPEISADGRTIVFSSHASNLVAADLNGVSDSFLADNPFLNPNQLLVTVEKPINNTIRDAQGTAAKLAAGTQYRQWYKVTNHSDNRIYKVQVFEDGNLVCNFYALNPGQSKKRCYSYQPVLEGDQHTEIMVSAKVSGTSEELTGFADAYYTGLTNVEGKLEVTYLINSYNAYTPDRALVLNEPQATFNFKVENTGEIELYHTKTYHDPVSPVNAGWAQQCNINTIKPGQVRYCKSDISLTEAGLNHAMGRVQARNAISGATNVVNAAAPVYFIVP